MGSSKIIGIMTIQTLSIEQMQHLQELGLDTSNASMCYYKKEGWESCYFLILSDTIKEKGGLMYCYDYLNDKEYILSEVVPAYTLQDVLDELPKEISKEGCTWYASLYIDFENNRIAYGNTDRYGFEIHHEIMMEKDLINAAYSMLCWAIENKFV